MKFAFAQRGPQQAVVRRAHDGDFARHVEQFQEESLLRQCPHMSGG